MSLVQLFWILSAAGAVLFFCAGLAAGTRKSQRALHDAKAHAAEIARLEALVVELGHRTASSNSTLAPVKLEEQTGNTNSSRSPAALEDVGGTNPFQSILMRLSKTEGVRAAVLGDSMGLPVAAIGEQSESLAGFCGFISQAVSKAKDFLALGRIRRIVIEDERAATLTACSITGTDIFLATLTSGPGPDLPRMMQILNDVKSFMLERSSA
jgi:predicted regulator of Ras-like GTPase activity (Roadblock/LC7/MglB family)